MGEAAHHGGGLPGAVCIDNAGPRQATAIGGVQQRRDLRVLHMEEVMGLSNAPPEVEREAGFLDFVRGSHAVAPAAEVSGHGGQTNGGGFAPAEAGDGFDQRRRVTAVQIDGRTGAPQTFRQIDRPGLDAAMNMAEAGTGDCDARRGAGGIAVMIRQWAMSRYGLS